MTTTYQAKPVRKRGVGGIQLGIDPVLLIAIVFLVLFGLVMVFSASWEMSYYEYEGSHTKMFTRQLIFTLVGVAAAFVAAYFDYHNFRRLALLLMGATVGLLILVQILQNVRFNAVRTLYEGSGMPSEMAKLVLIIYLSVWLYNKRHQLNKVGFGLIPLAIIIGFLAGLIIVQPDVSAAFTLVILGGIMFFVAGGDLKQIFILLAVTFLVGLVVIQVQPTAQDRISDYLQGLRDPREAHPHVQRSIEAFARGGLFGMGIDKSETKTHGLPVPPTDSIFAVTAEETGLLGTTVMIGLYVILTLRGFKIAREAPDMLGQLLAIGITFWLMMEALINMGMMVGLVPFAGNALPFVSLGGTSMLFSLSSIGILMNVSRQSRASRKTDERKEYAPVGVRRGERGRDLSRAGRSASPRG
ncbi:MAG: FtsW/RodA/SpoVE family cell cycle protein [Anaerolineales bacterium]|nr:FtsW/RodA/SpoVE family cell cycle protein [Anaerolineales bacterium]